MLDYAKRIREPALVVLLSVLGLHLAVTVGYFALLVGRRVGWGVAAQVAGGTVSSLIWVFAVVAMVLACLLARPATAHARRLTQVAAGLVTVVTVVQGGLLISGLLAGVGLGAALTALGGLIDTLVKAACAVVLWRLYRVSVEEQGRIEQATAPSGDMPGERPVWDPAQAVGRQWARAGDAATGAPAPGQPGLATGTPALPPAPEPVPKPSAPPRQTWSRGGVLPEPRTTSDGAAKQAAPGPAPADRSQPPKLPWTTAGQAARGDVPEGGPGPDATTPRPAPDWTPAPREPAD